MINWDLIRSEFPSLARYVYLNTAAYGQTPRRAAQAMACHMARREEFACADFLSWFDDLDRIRESCARLVNCAPADIAFVQAACVGLSWLMQGLNWQPGDELLTIENEFPNQLYLSAALDRFGAKLRIVPWPEFYASVTSKTRVVALSTVNYASGFRPPMEEISQFLESRGVLFYVDGTQSVGVLEFDISKIRPAMLSVDAYKWLLTPNGAGFVYVSPDLRSRLAPTVIGWRTDRNWREVNSLNHGAPVIAESAEKYEGGMLPFPSLYAMGPVIDMMVEIGPAAIEERVLSLAATTRAILRDLGGDVNTDESQIVTASLPGRDPAELAQRLRDRGILVSARHGRLRVSPHFYNNESDLEALRTALIAA
jgi:selenocysteine lyase/cysteine desulfurase